MTSKENFDYLVKACTPGIRAREFNNYAEYLEKGEELVTQIAKVMLPDVQLEPDEIKSILDEIESDNFYTMEPSATCATEATINDDWLEKADIDFEYASRYFAYLDRNKQWPESSISALSEDSFKVVQMLGDPSVSGSLHRKGLLIGDVQSGKTANYTAILNRAVDVGYNVIILLAGTTSVLRKQTQQRIDEELVGMKMAGRSTIVGVGLNSKLNRIITATSESYDYSKAVSKTQSVPIQEGKTLLFVTKKNVTTLNSIATALEKSNTVLATGVDGQLNASLLLVDDEADNASVDTNTKNPDDDPTAINKGIRRLLHMFSRTAYLAVTATPFANIFIDEKLKKEFGEDLFPSDFIFLTSRPPKYVGALSLFGDVEIPNHQDADGNPVLYSNFCLRKIDDNEMETTYKFKHKSDLVVNDFSALPNVMKQAIRYFILVQQLMDRLPDVGRHRSMMINVSRYRKVQNNLFRRLEEWRKDKLVPQVKKYANYPEAADDETSGEYHQLKLVWDSENLGALSGMSWEAFSPSLLNHIDDVRIAVVNDGKLSKQHGLDYDGYPEGDRVIAVGGQCLSRGLTLEGLVVSFFYRNSAAYDTLLQMGRWFGYRTEYIKYFRLWISDASRSWYRMISDACEDLRVQVNKMNAAHRPPDSYGLAVKYHPCTNLIITARNKMRSAALSNQRVITDLRGRLIESPRLLVDRIPNMNNAALVENFMDSVCASRQSVAGRGGVYWKNVSREDIADFVMRFQSSKLSIGFRVSELSKYIRTNTGESWDVAIAQSKLCDENTRSFHIGDSMDEYHTISRQYECRKETYDVMLVSKHNVRVGTGPVTRVGLSEDDLAKIEAYYLAQSRTEWERYKSGSSVYLQKIPGVERNSVLILYPLLLRGVGEDGQYGIYNDEELKVVWAIGLGFAGGESASNESECFSFVLNPVAQIMDWALDDDGQGDEDED